MESYVIKRFVLGQFSLSHSARPLSKYSLFTTLPKNIKFLILYKLQTELNEFDEDIVVDRSKLKRCCRSSIKSFTSDVLSCVFSDKELGTSSVSGKTSNFNPNSQRKPALDPKRLNAVESKHFLFLYYYYLYFLT